MENANTQIRHLGATLSGFWRRVPVAIRAIVLGFLVAEVGITAWIGSLILLPGVWPLVAMSIALTLFAKYFSGSWWPVATAETRRSRFRALKLPAGVWAWGLAAAALLVIAWQSGVVLTFRLVEFPAESFTKGYNFDAMPAWAAWSGLIMASLVAGICEETGFRGYMQVPLEKRYGPGVGIAITSFIFMVFHLNQAWAPPVLLHIFVGSSLIGILAYASNSIIPGIIAHVGLDVVNFSYWWSDVAGTFDMQTIAKTGIDIHFVTWVLIFATSMALFFWAIRKVLAIRQQETS